MKKENKLITLPEKKIITRRSFLNLFWASASYTLLAANAPHKLDYLSEKAVKNQGDQIIFARVKYKGGDWDADTIEGGGFGGAEIHLLERVILNTTLKPKITEHVVSLEDDKIFDYPFLFVTGHKDIYLSELEVDNLRTHLNGGGVIYGEDCRGTRGVGLDLCFRREIARVYPNHPLKPIPMEHPLFHCMFDLNEFMGGDKLILPWIEGIEVDGRLRVIYSINDYACAWEGHGCRPHGDRQREWAFKFGMNLLTYVMV